MTTDKVPVPEKTTSYIKGQTPQNSEQHRAHPITVKRVKHAGFDTDLILNVDEIRALGVDPQSQEYREYLGLGNFVLINGQAKHYANKPPSSKEDLYGNDKGVFTRALSSTPNSAVKDLNAIAKDIRKQVNFDLYSWDLAAIRERRSLIISEFISTIPESLVP